MRDLGQNYAPILALARMIPMPNNAQPTEYKGNFLKIKGIGQIKSLQILVLAIDTADRFLSPKIRSYDIKAGILPA